MHAGCGHAHEPLRYAATVVHNRIGDVAQCTPCSASTNSGSALHSITGVLLQLQAAVGAPLFVYSQTGLMV